MRVRSQHNYKQRRIVKVVIVALVIVVVGMLVPKLISVISTAVLYPIHATNQWLDESTSLIPTFVRERSALHDQIETLEQEILVLKRTSLTQQRLWEENNRLRGLLGAYGEERIAAGVIARPNELPYDLLQIDKGYDQGIEVGAPVFIGNDIVIGLVVHTAANYSFVELITTPGFEASVFISGPDVAVTMEGVGGGVARVRVPQGVPLRKGNMVYLPSIEPGLYGRIAFVNNSPTQPEQYGYISPDLAISGLHQVAVGQQSQITRSAEEVDENVAKIIQESLLISGLELDVSTSSSTTTDQTIE